MKSTLAWLADAPRFIDERGIASFYDAVVRPQSETGKVTISLEKIARSMISGEATAEATIGLAKWVETLLPGLRAEVTGSLKGAAEGEKAETEGTTVELLPISNANRQIIQLALHYAADQPSRLKVVLKPAEKCDEWLNVQFIRESPRGLVFLDLPACTQFIPTAAELTNGKVIPLYPEIVKKIRAKKPERSVPVYPEPAGAEESPAELSRLQKEYWGFFADHFSSTDAMMTIEEAIGEEQRIEWIDYRVPVSSNRIVHIHLCGRGQFPTGDFAYNLVKRGYKHGVRVVGTLRSGPSVNVLAYFDK